MLNIASRTPASRMHRQPRVGAGRHSTPGHLQCSAAKHKPAAVLRHSCRQSVSCRAVDVEPAATAAEAKQMLSSEQLPKWQACVEQLTSGVGFSEEDAERLLAKGHGWTSRAYWGAERYNIVPEPEHVSQVLHYLQSTLGLEGADLLKVIKMFPEALACSLEDRLLPNVARFESEWFMKGDVLKRAIVRKPTLLGLSVDCSTIGSGACQGQCSKCWSAN